MEHRPTTDPTYSGLLPPSRSAPMPTSERASFRWPSERHLTPIHCGHCGARLLKSDTPSADHPTITVTCLMCTRDACELVADGLREPLKELVDMGPPRRGRPPGKRGPRAVYATLSERQAAYRERERAGLVTRQRWARSYDACVVCGTTERRHNGHGHCTRCRDRSAEPYRVARKAGTA